MSADTRQLPRYRFGDFALSPRRRLLVRDGVEQPLIPRYFDLLVFLVEHRDHAVHRRDIFDRVWSDVVVSDSALSQAVRTIRRTLGDDSREARFIRTVSRHGYQFVWSAVIEEDDDGAWAEKESGNRKEQPDIAESGTAIDDSGFQRSDASSGDPFEPLLARLTRQPRTVADEEDRREAAELLHALGTDETLRRLHTRPRHAVARAILRDTRWDTPTAGAVPLIGEPAPIASAAALVALRLRRAARLAAARWTSAACGAGLTGGCAGAIGGLMLALTPSSTAPVTVAPVLAFIGATCGAAGGAGVGAGLAMVEAVTRSSRTIALTLGGAVGGGLAGLTVRWLAHWSLLVLVGLDLPIGGGLEGLLIGAASGLAYAATTADLTGGMAAPTGRRRTVVGLATAAACGVAALVITLAGRPLVGGTVHAIAQTSQHSSAALTPLGRLIGEPDFGPISRTLIGIGEGAMFGLGLALGVTRRPQT